MAQSAIDKIPPGPQLDALTAEKVFGWKNVHKHEGALVGKKQDKAGHWRLAKVPYYSTNPVHAYPIEDRMKQLGRLDRYQKELSKITRSKNIPSDWASPDQRCRAAIKAMGQYGQGHSFEQTSQTDSKIESASLSHCGFVQTSPAPKYHTRFRGTKKHPFEGFD